MSKRFEGARVLVTGATRGIGAACAKAFLAEGARVAINGRSEGSVEKAMPEMGRLAVPAPGDVATVAGCEAAVEAALAAFGGLDVLVNNAGVFLKQSIADTDERGWDAVMNANVKSVQFCTRAALPALVESKGNIVNVASEAGLNGYPETTAYCASKGAVVNLTRAMAMELAPDIRVNAVCPGVVETDLSRSGFAVEGDADEGIRRQHLAYPLHRIGTLEEAAGCCHVNSDPVAGFDQFG